MDISFKKNIAENLLKIRCFEEKLDNLFQNQKIYGTYHRCIGQEATAVSFTHFLDKQKDYVVSNHRNHGHYLAFKKNFEALIDELKGEKSGASKGKGGSQVICDNNFLSNGIFGLVPFVSSVGQLKTTMSLFFIFWKPGNLLYPSWIQSRYDGVFLVNGKVLCMKGKNKGVFGTLAP